MKCLINRRNHDGFSIIENCCAVSISSCQVCASDLKLSARWWWLPAPERISQITNLCKKNSTRFQVLNPNPWAPGQFFYYPKFHTYSICYSPKFDETKKKSQSNFGFRRDGQIDGIARNVSWSEPFCRLEWITLWRWEDSTLRDTASKSPSPILMRCFIIKSHQRKHNPLVVKVRTIF